MYIIDSHCDSIQQVDQRNHGIVNPYNFSGRYPQLQLVAAFCSWPGEDKRKSYERACRYIGQFLIAMENEKDRVMQVKTAADIETAFAAGKHGAMLTIEGGTGIMGSVDIFREFRQIGVRVFGLAWLSNDLAKSNRVFDDGEEDTGLTDIGREIVAEGNRLGMIFDVSHLSDKSFRDIIEIAEKPVIASHSNFRALCGHSRNLTDEMAKALVDRGGMIGLNLCTSFIHEETEKRTLEYFFNHLDYCLEKFGEDCIGFGGDVDGVSGVYPAPLTTERPIHDQLIEYMEDRGYSAEIIEKAAYRNYLNYFKKYL